MALPLSTPPEIVFGGLGRGAGGGGGMVALEEPGPLFCEAGAELPRSWGGAEDVSVSLRAGLGDALDSLAEPDDRLFALSCLFACRPMRLQSERASTTMPSAKRDFISFRTSVEPAQGTRKGSRNQISSLRRSEMFIEMTAPPKTP